eukprot:m.49148 g.49148  ORF g.49148 m.49148 type:complete len:298 (-) comp7437_c0_seq1:416-1309(-)
MESGIGVGVGVGIVIVCGLPGSGKSFVSSLLLGILQHGTQDAVDGDWVGIDFDDICEGEGKCPSCIQDDGIMEEKQWKEKRKEAINVVEGLLHQNKCVIVDDTFHLRSMRRQLYQVAREAEVGFGILFVKSDVKVCVNRDRLRDHPIGSEMISNMATRFEEPQEPWEVANVMILENNNDDADDSKDNEPLKAHACVDFVNRCVHSPLSSYVALQEAKDVERKRTAENMKHQNDLVLRDAVKRIMANEHFSTAKREVKQQAARALGVMKRELKEKLDCGAITMEQAIYSLENFHLSNQ